MYLRVSDLIENNAVPIVSPEESITNVIIEISEKRLGVTAVISDKNIIGIITDGDIRRMLKDNLDIKSLKAKDILNKNPKTIKYNAMALEALELMENNNITQLLVTKNGNYKGVVHLHDILKEGII